MTTPNQTPTPETLLDWQQKSSIHTNISDNDCDKLNLLFGKLERERDEAKKLLLASLDERSAGLIREQNLMNERDQLRSDIETMEQRHGAVMLHQQSVVDENTQLRKVADIFANVISRFKEPRFDAFEHNDYIAGSTDMKRAIEAIAAYNELTKGTK